MNVDQAELSKFNELASRWWDPTGEFRPLHEINPLRLDWIDRHVSLSGKRVIDIGCGGGILAESMAARGARVLGIDMADKPLKVAQLHQLESGIAVDYKRITAEAMAEAEPASFDVVTCMEMLEHVPDPASTVAACAALVKPGGHVCFSTLNRNLKSYLLAIVGAEYVLRMLPRGTHDYEKFIKPSELTGFVRAANLTPREIAGMNYNPLSRQFSLSRDTDVNYLMATTRT